MLNKAKMKNMKTNKISIVAICIILSTIFAGCQKEMMKYEGEEGVYFAVQYGGDWGDTTKWSYFPLTKIEFIKAKTNDTIHKIRVSVTGGIKDYGRKFKMIVETDSTTAVEGDNFDKLPEYYTIEAGRHYLDIPITLHRNQNITLEAKRVMFRLVPTEDFTLSIPVWEGLPDLWPNNEYPKFDNTRHALILTDFIVCPEEWAGGPAENAAVGETEGGFLGQFTVKKFKLICEVMATKGRILTYSDFSSPETMPSALLKVISETLAEYLTELYNAKTPVLEEDGRLMYADGCPWVSKIGIPYIPED